MVIYMDTLLVSTRIDGRLLPICIRPEAAVFFNHSDGERTTTLTAKFQRMISRSVAHLSLVDDNALYSDDFHKRLREREREREMTSANVVVDLYPHASGR